MSPATWVALFGGFGGAIVLLYLLRLRRRRMEVPFGALWQLVLAEKQTTSLFKALRNLFSLFVQLLILATVLTAIADPEWTGDISVEEASPRSVEPSHTLLVVDTSASMDPVFASARSAALEVVDHLRPGERIMLLTFDRDTVPATDWSSDPEVLRAAIAALQPRHAANATPTLEGFALEAVRGLPNAQMVLITDRRFEPVAKEVLAFLDARVVAVGPEATLPNVALTGFAVRSHLGGWQAEGEQGARGAGGSNRLRYALHYTLVNQSDTAVTTKVHVYVSDKARSRDDFTRGGPPVRAAFEHRLAPGETKAFDQLGVDLDGARAMLLAETSGDGLAVDDVAFAAIPERKSVRVQLVGADNLFLRAALATRRAVEVVLTAPEAFAGTAGFDLTIFDGVTAAGPVRGNVLYLNVSPQATDVPFTPGKALTEVGEALVPPSAAAHPVMAHVRFVNLEIPAATELQRKRKQEVLARTKAGAALLVAGATPEQRYVAVGFDPVGAGWVMHYSFSVFFVNAVNWFFHEESALREAETLTEAWGVRLPWAEGGGIRRATIVRPDGREETALVDGAGGLAYTGDHVGVYEVKGPEQAVLVPALLGSPAESRLEPLGSYDAWEAPAATPEDLPSLNWRGLRLWQLLVLAAGALLLLEWFSWHRRWTT